MKIIHYLIIIIFTISSANPLSAQEMEKNNIKLISDSTAIARQVIVLSQQIMEQDRTMRYLAKYMDLYFQSLSVRSFPVQNFYNYYSPLSPNLYITTYHGTEVYPGLGAVTPISGTLTWMPNNHFIISGGMYVAKMFYHPSQLSPITDGGVNLDIQYLANDWLSFRAFGNYSITDRMNQNIPIFFPQNMVGGGARVMFNENFGLEGGVMFQQFNGRMRPGVYAAPVIKAGNVKIEVRPSISVGR